MFVQEGDWTRKEPHCVVVQAEDSVCIGFHGSPDLLVTVMAELLKAGYKVSTELSGDPTLTQVTTTMPMPQVIPFLHRYFNTVEDLSFLIDLIHRPGKPDGHLFGEEPCLS